MHYRVTSVIYSDGRTESDISGISMGEAKPADTMREKCYKTTFYDWFGSREEAECHVADVMALNKPKKPYSRVHGGQNARKKTNKEAKADNARCGA